MIRKFRTSIFMSFNLMLHVFPFLFSSTHNIMTPFCFFLDFTSFIFTFVNGMRCGVLWQQRTNKECRKLYADKKLEKAKKAGKLFFMLTLLPQSKQNHNEVLMFRNLISILSFDTLFFEGTLVDFCGLQCFELQFQLQLPDCIEVFIRKIVLKSFLFEFQIHK